MRSATVYNFLIEANIMAGIAIVLMLAVRKFFRGEIGSRVLWFAWLLVAVRLLCPLALPNPAINEIRSPFSRDQAIRPIAGQVRVRFMDTASNIHVAAGRNSPVGKAALKVESATFNGELAGSLLWVYFTGAAGVLLYMVSRNVCFLKKLKKNRVEKLSGAPYEQYIALCKEKSVSPVPVYLTDPLPGAMVAGVFRPFIALPLSTPPKDIMRVLAHEVCHVKGRDNLWGLVRNLCCVIHWFNPLVWLAAAMSRTDCELKCDGRVIAKLNQEDKIAYANTLVQASLQKSGQGLMVIATCMSMTGREMKKRVKQIVGGNKTLRWLSASFAAIASLTLLLAFATAEYIPVFVSDPPIAVEGFATFTEIQGEDKALAYAKAFLGHESVGADTDRLDYKISREYDTWTVEAYPSGEKAYVLIFNTYGMITLYRGSGADLDYAHMKPSENLLTDASLDGLQYLHFVFVFANTMLPGVGTAFDVNRIDSDVTDGSGRYLFISTGNGRVRNAHSFTLQIEPRIRLLAFQPVADYLAFNVTGDRNALSVYTEKNARQDMKSYLTEVVNITAEQVEKGNISAVYLADEKVWVASFAIASAQVNGEQLKTLQNTYGFRESYTVEMLFDPMGGMLYFKNLDEYRRWCDTAIGEEKAMEIALKAVADNMALEGLKINNVTLNPDHAEYNVQIRHYDDIYWGLVRVDAYTGEAKLIIKYSHNGQLQSIKPVVMENFSEESP